MCGGRGGGVGGRGGGALGTWLLRCASSGLRYGGPPPRARTRMPARRTLLPNRGPRPPAPAPLGARRAVLPRHLRLLRRRHHLLHRRGRRLWQRAGADGGRAGEVAAGEALEARKKGGRLWGVRVLGGVFGERLGGLKAREEGGGLLVGFRRGFWMVWWVWKVLGAEIGGWQKGFQPPPCRGSTVLSHSGAHRSPAPRKAFVPPPHPSHLLAAHLEVVAVEAGVAHQLVQGARGGGWGWGRGLFRGGERGGPPHDSRPQPHNPTQSVPATRSP